MTATADADRIAADAPSRGARIGGRDAHDDALVDGPRAGGSPVSVEDRVPIEPQAVLAPLSRSAVFLSLDLVGGQDAADRVRDVVADVGGILRAVGFRDLGLRLSCLVGIGSGAWDRFGGTARIRLEASSIVTGRSRAWASSSARSCRVIGGDPCGGPCRDPRGGSPPEAWPFQAHLARRSSPADRLAPVDPLSSQGRSSA
ncbi:hypothetical protein C5C27_09445 [Rathayibacter sp. AY2B7]|nr:hypothetical protein C5C27_09445 [Rathayibacter sp. AY2B7]